MSSPFNKLVPATIDGRDKLGFNLKNAKLLGSKTAAFSLPAGYTCPGACDCLAWFDREENRMKDGPKTQFRCFAATMEGAFRTVRNSVDHNLALLKEARSRRAMAELIDMSLPAATYKYVRVHADGDFFNKSYFLAWMDVARENPQRLFYAYTKSLPIWTSNMEEVPENFVLTASYGGKWDSMIEGNRLRSAKVVFHPDEAEAQGLEIDHDDSHARDPECGSFALLIHGTQPKGSEASQALKRMREEGVEYSYGKKPARKGVTA